jgi:hypothetical protein
MTKATLVLLLVLGLASVGLAAAAAPAPSPQEPRDWTWVQGAVFVPTNAVNEAQQWDEYDPEVNDRELHAASVYGINVVRVYLHYYVYLKKKDVLLRDIEDFLQRANRYGIKTEFVFFDDCWNQPPEELLSPDYKYPAPLPGVHNSRWLVSPGAQVQAHYAEHRPRLQAYVQDIVRAHRDDGRIAFWEIYNEPTKSPETLRLEQDAAGWIKETGTRIPATATGREYSGEPFSDFRSWHEYGNYNYVGDPQSLNTECMNRPGQSVPGVVAHFRGKTGFILWECGIGRDNCRFAWDENRDHPRRDEAVTPFHGIVYPDGHPWAVEDVQALLGPQRFAATPFFTVKYFTDAGFKTLAKTSIVPFIDFDLVDEPGVGSPDATARIPRERFSIEYAGTIVPPATGAYTITADCDHRVTLSIDGKTVIDKTTPGRAEATSTLQLIGGKDYLLSARYIHATGAASLHLTWSGPGLVRRVIEPASVFVSPGNGR